MSNVEQIKNQVANVSPVKSIETMVKNSMKTLGEALPSHMNAERLVRIALTTMRLNPDLYKCSPDSFIGALFQSAQLGLEPNVEGQAYIIPFNNNRKDRNGNWVKVKEAQFQIGYKGFIELFYRHANAVSLDVQEVRENDRFDYQYGTEAYIKHSPKLGDRGNVIGYYAIAKMKGGANVFHVMSLEECIEHGKKHSKCWDSKSGAFYKNTPWATNTSAMCKKTVLIQLMKLLPKSVELQKAVAMDATVKTEIMPDMSESKDHMEWEEAQIAPDGPTIINKEEPEVEVTVSESGASTVDEPEPEPQYINPDDIVWDDEPEPPKEKKRLITEKQRKRLYAIGKSVNHNPEQIKEYIKVRYGYESMSDIEMDEYESICNHFEGMKS